MWSTEVGQCIIYSGKIYGQKMTSLSKAISVAQCHRWFTSLWPTIRPVRCLLVILGKTLLYYVTLPSMRMSSVFLWPLCLWTKRSPSTVSIALCLLRTLLSMGFSPSLISWVKRLYADIRSSILVDGYVSPSLKPPRGAGCAVRLSSVAFALCAHHGGVGH